jgi:hypothetical protein
MATQGHIVTTHHVVCDVLGGTYHPHALKSGIPRLLAQSVEKRDTKNRVTPIVIVIMYNLAPTPESLKVILKLYWWLCMEN